VVVVVIAAPIAIAKADAARARASLLQAPPSSLRGFWVEVLDRNYRPVTGASVAFRARWNGLIDTRGGGETGEGGDGQGIVGKPDKAVVTVMVTPPGEDKATERTVAWREGEVETIILSVFPPAIQYHG